MKNKIEKLDKNYCRHGFVEEKMDLDLIQIAHEEIKSSRKIGFLSSFESKCIDLSSRNLKNLQ